MPTTPSLASGAWRPLTVRWLPPLALSSSCAPRQSVRLSLRVRRALSFEALLSMIDLQGEVSQIKIRDEKLESLLVHTSRFGG